MTRVVFAVLISSFFASVSGFGISPNLQTLPRFQTSLCAEEVPDSVLNEEQLELRRKCERWATIKVLDEEDAKAQLEGDELQSYLDYHQHIKDDIERMVEISYLIEASMDKGKGIKAKSKNQRKRDKFARQQAYADTSVLNNALK
mmetsp:Transcript_4212/g.5412  ORF Transcript_4212/g.5412 Transcript_4212/m.5412 type:complete len:145 (-) Transcript_4212:52-486(-)|eukprot:CAMPEP_0172499802 /NCGR_PEP_ID=MMETSP1066-20121228/131071_1 /TAXON_ID=671091 /ORGANISM="Coscinodiscus wailesii, Strain CCMP2513" /LENGTH=144 /DNA_ID=CAMNT_0013273731 /DNA_START=131 /DNA_END=565 /DNA_ORIENTATION=+